MFFHKFMSVNHLNPNRMKKASHNARFAAFVLLTSLLYYLLYSNAFSVRELSRLDGLYEEGVYIALSLLKAVVGTMIVGAAALAIAAINPYPDYGRYVSAAAALLCVALGLRHVYVLVHHGFGGFLREYGLGIAMTVATGLYLAAKANLFFQRQRYL